MKGWIGRAGGALLGGLVLACGNGGAETHGQWEAVTDTAADTVVVRTVAGSVWGDTAELVEEVRIGALEGADEYLLGDPASLAVDGRGVLYVLDVHVPVVRAYDPSGRHLRDVGREGAGPGEYRSPDAIAVLPDDRLLVRDPRNIRINVYDPDGELIEAWPHPNRGDFNTSRRFYVDTAGRSYVTALLSGGPPWEWVLGLIAVSTQGEVVDTLPEPPLAYEPSVVTASRADGTSASRRQVPFTGEKVWDFSPRGYVVAGITDRYAIYLFRPDGVLRIEREAEPVPVVPEEGEERRQRITDGLQRQYGAWKWNGPSVPDVKPPFRAVFADTEGRVWVVRSRPGQPVMSEAEATAVESRTGTRPLRFREPVTFDLFDDQGRFLGPVRAPAGIRLDPAPLVRGDTMWAVVEGEAGVPVVARYRLQGGAPGPRAQSGEPGAGTG